jgi:hypothetical protein
MRFWATPRYRLAKAVAVNRKATGCGERERVDPKWIGGHVQAGEPPTALLWREVSVPHLLAISATLQCQAVNQKTREFVSGMFASPSETKTISRRRDTGKTADSKWATQIGLDLPALVENILPVSASQHQAPKKESPARHIAPGRSKSLLLMSLSERSAFIAHGSRGMCVQKNQQPNIGRSGQIHARSPAPTPALSQAPPDRDSLGHRHTTADPSR